VFVVVFMLASAGLLFIVDSAQKAAEEKVLQDIVDQARARAKKAEKQPPEPVKPAQQPKTEKKEPEE